MSQAGSGLSTAKTMSVSVQSRISTILKNYFGVTSALGAKVGSKAKMGDFVEAINRFKYYSEFLQLDSQIIASLSFLT